MPLVTLAFALIGADAALSQQPSSGQPASPGGLERGTVVSPVLTIDSERIFLESDFGRRVVNQIEAESAVLARENRQIEAELEAEEQDLTAKRAEMAPEDFRELANAFDEKVQNIRRAQAEKGRAINAMLEDEREVFLTAAGPVLERLMRDAGAAVILERRSVFVSANAIDITNDAIALLNETLNSPDPAQDP
ncbi:OmpH family outer membrane protein [Sulfitobacter sp. JB4-11]|uniref:OmpH family outer membrane protein n=1 Tax=Sulfitobacter rhodophyticola TaxID=3238304 RepID=UPI003D8181B5